MFPNFFSGESGSLTSLFFGVCFLLIHLCVMSDIRDFVRDFGSNFYTISHAARREDSSTAIIAYVFFSFFLAGSAGAPQTLFGFAVWVYGALVAWRIGELIALKAIRRRLAIQVARDQIAQGHFNPPPADAAPAPLVIEHQPTYTAPVSLGARGAPQDEGAFAFDPDKFKR